MATAQKIPASPRRRWFRPSRQTLALLAALATVVVWGASFAIIRSAIAEVPPFTMAFLRFALASALLLPAAWPLYRRSPIARGDRWAVFGLGSWE